MFSLVLPKGSLEENTFRLFTDADLTPLRADNRDYSITIDDPRIGVVKLLRPQEIAQYVQRGLFDVGITGLDWIRETGSDVVEVLDLAYAKVGVSRPVKIVLAVADNCGVTCGAEVKPSWRVATEYPRLTQEYFDKLGIPVEVLLSYGATEAKVPDIADAIVEITETGSTIRRQGLRIIDVVLLSSTKLIANKNAWADPDKRREIEEICTLFRAVLDARGKVLIKLNVGAADLQQVMAILPAMKSPTVSSLFNEGFYAVETVVPKSEINKLLPELKRLGASGILELPILKAVD